MFIWIQFQVESVFTFDYSFLSVTEESSAVEGSLTAKMQKMNIKVSITPSAATPQSSGSAVAENVAEKKAEVKPEKAKANLEVDFFSKVFLLIIFFRILRPKHCGIMMCLSLKRTEFLPMSGQG